MSIELSQDDRFYSYPTPLAEAYRGAIPLSDVIFWLIADRGLTIESDMRLTSWSDVMSSSGVTFTQNTLANRPLVKRNAVNFKDTILFDSFSSGLAKFYSRSFPFVFGVCHFFCVFKVNQLTDSNIFGAESTSTQRYRWSVFSNKFRLLANTSPTTLLSTFSVPQSQYLIIEVIKKPVSLNSEIYFNGTKDASENAVSGGSATGGAVYQIGHGHSTLVDTEIAEMLMLSTPISDPTNVRKYLSLKYNIPLTFS